MRKKPYGARLLFILYLAVIFRITVFRAEFNTHPLFSGSVNCSLFMGYGPILANRNWGAFVYLFFGNIVWFIPFGAFLSGLYRRDLKETILLGFLLSLSIETFQFVFATGLSEADDLILNTLGVFLGWWAVFCLRRGDAA